MTTESLLFSLLRFVICEEKIDNRIKSCCEPERLEELYTLSKKHDLAHLAGYALEKLELPQMEIFAKFKTAKMRAIYRYLQYDQEAKRLYSVLEEARIPFIPLKGSVIRGYYPQPWMRTSCDIDILVPEQMLEQAATALTEKLGYVGKGKSDHDISMRSPKGIHLDLHYTAVDKERFPQAQNVLGKIWQNADKIKCDGFRRELTDEMFYFYHIAHMAKHIENGGCGIRPFLDLWILNHRIVFDCEKRKQLLREGNLLDFALAAQKLSEIWFSQKETDSLSKKFESYVLRGGTYGIQENRVGVYQSKLGGRFGYARQRIFLPYNSLKYHYPILQKYRFLMPVFEVVRWLKLLFKGGIKRSIHELKVNAAVSDETRDETQIMLQYLGLEET